MKPQQKNKKIEFRVINLADPNRGVETEKTSYASTGFAEWFSGKNDYPNQLNERARLSSTHSRILRDKVVYTTGKGFSFEGSGAKKAEEYAKAVNAKGESLRYVFRKLATDYVRHGNAFFNVIDAGGGRVNIEHLDAANCRIGKDENAGYTLYSKCWNSSNLDQYKPIRLPLAKTIGGVAKQKQQVIHITNYESGYHFYGIPDYIAAFSSGWLDIDYQVPKYNLARFHNQFRPSGMLVFVGQNLEPNQAKQLQEEFRKNYQGEGNGGKMMMLTVNDETLAPKFIQFNDAPEGAFELLQEQANANIILAHQWHPALVVQQPGKLSNSSDIMAAYETVMSTTIADIREAVLEPLRLVLTERIGLNLETVEVVNSEPVSLRGKIDPKEVLTKEEMRKIIGMK